MLNSEKQALKYFVAGSLLEIRNTAKKKKKMLWKQ